MTEPLLRVRDLRVFYGPVRAVNGLNFELGLGDVLALLGPNGAGKSSTLRAITGLAAFSGTVELAGRSLTRLSPDRLARAGLVHVPEGRQIFATLSVHENLQVATKAAGGRPALLSIDEIYELFPSLWPLRERRGWTLSGGEQQMLAVGRGLLGAPRVLLLDEPSLGLAPSVGRSVFSALAQIAPQVPMLIVEQNTAAALDVATRGIVLAHGVPVLEGTPADLRRDDSLVTSYLGAS